MKNDFKKDRWLAACGKVILRKGMPGLFIVSLGAFFYLFSAILIPADNPNINYFGRFDISTPAAPQFNWSGAVIEATFPGPYIGFKLTDGKADYDVEIDGVIDTIIRTKSNVTQYTIATNLSAESHTIRIVKRSESQWNPAIFGGIYLADGKSLLSAPAKPKRKIEFIGDSYTAGYGNESPGQDCTEEQKNFYTNANRAFPMLITKAFHAQPMILGWSGEGMVRNYDDKAKKSEKPYPFYYGNTLCDIKGNWDFVRWTPDLVVICLCTNDYSTTPYPDDTMFINAYHAFIARILGNYPGVPILCVGTNTGPSNGYIKRMVTEETGSLGHAKVYVDSFPKNLKTTGCHSHPNVSDDSAVTKALVPKIMKIMNWDTASVTGIDRGRVHDKKNASSALKVRVSGNRAVFTAAPAMAAGEDIAITDCKGRIAAEGALDGRGVCVWDFSRVAGGVYVAGNGKVGWARMVVRK